jgi:cytosine/adenosine deaminase-related metal-dependent hydrolase
MPGPILLTAAWIAPMNGPMLREAAVVFNRGLVQAIGPIARLRREYPQTIVHDAGNAVVLPGLVNAHTHLELSHLTPGNPPARFVDWIIQLMQRADPTKTPEAVQIGIRQCLQFGVTCVGDITANPATTRPILANSPLTGVSYGEVRGMAQRRSLIAPRIAAAIDSTRLKGDLATDGAQMHTDKKNKDGLTPPPSSSVSICAPSLANSSSPRSEWIAGI